MPDHPPSSRLTTALRRLLYEETRRKIPRVRSCAVGALLTWTVAACAGDVPTSPFRTESDTAKSSLTAPVVVAPSPAPSAGIIVADSSVDQPIPQFSKPEWQLLLEDGIDSYESGAYGNAIRKLEEAANDPQADKASRVRALKYLAFSYCVSPDPAQNRKIPSHLTLCRQSFERALAIDPAFELAQVERGHPVWGKEFQAARNAKSTRSSPAGSVSAARPGTQQPSSPARGAASSTNVGAETQKP
jgi:hypothetical protein